MEAVNTGRLIELYQQYPCLWDSSNPDHKNKDQRQMALEAIIFRAGIPVTIENVKFLKRKINTIRTGYTRELGKVLNSQKAATDPAEVYRPKWIFFDKIDSFLRETCNIRNGRSMDTFFPDQDGIDDSQNETDDRLGHFQPIKEEKEEQVSFHLSLSNSDCSVSEPGSPRVPSELGEGDLPAYPECDSATAERQLSLKRKHSDSINTPVQQLDSRQQVQNFMATSCSYPSKRKTRTETSLQSQWRHFGLYVGTTLENFDPLLANAAAGEIQNVLSRYTAELYQQQMGSATL